jgi:predicted nucleic acid-binding protein
MPKRTVYLETSVIGYATTRPLRGVLATARQAITRTWFERHAEDFDLFVSDIVIRECASGDPGAAQERAAFLRGYTVLALNDDVRTLATKLVAEGAVPKQAADDAYHIAVAAVHGTEYVLTWNCRHIANATMRGTIERVCREAGYEPPVICTPEELSSDEQG